MNGNLILDERPLLVIPSLASKIGLNESIILQQLHYWLRRSKNIRLDRKWVYFTYDNLVEQFPFFSKSTIRRCITNLEKRGLLMSDVFNKMKMDHTKWYSIDYEVLEDLSNSSDQNEQVMCPIVEGDMPILNKGSVQNEQTASSSWNDGGFIMDSAIPEISSEITTKISTETSSTNDFSRNEEDDTCSNAMDPFQFYDQNGFGMIGGFMSEKLNVWCMDLSDELVIEAMKLAVKNGSKRWNYVEAILVDWVGKGYQTPEDFYAERLAFKESKKSSGHIKKPLRQEIVPKWLRNDDQHPTIAAPNPTFDEKKREIEERIRMYFEKTGGNNEDS